MNSSRDKGPKCSHDDIDIYNMIYFSKKQTKQNKRMQSFEWAKIVKIAINILGIHYLIIINVPMRLCGFCWYGFRVGLVIPATFDMQRQQEAHQYLSPMSNHFCLYSFVHHKRLSRDIFEMQKPKRMNMTNTGVPCKHIEAKKKWLPFPDNFKWIFFDVRLSIKISLKFFSKWFD